MDDIEEEILICAERYALGRRTYVVADVSTYIGLRLREMATKTLHVLYNDIETPLNGNYGDDCDRERWMRLLGDIREELDRRDYDTMLANINGGANGRREGNSQYND